MKHKNGFWKKPPKDLTCKTSNLEKLKNKTNLKLRLIEIGKKLKTQSRKLMKKFKVQKM